MVGKRTLSFCVCVPLLIIINALLATVQAVEQHTLPSGLIVRNATVSDAAGITTVILAAFHDSPPTKYMYQFQDEYPEDLFNCTYANIVQFFDLPKVVGLVELVDLPSKEPPHDMIPVAVAAWALPHRRPGLDSLSPLGLFAAAVKCSNRDVNMTRFNDHQRQFNRDKQRYLDDVYDTSHQFYLNTLGTHPDYQRRGAAGALLRSGLAFGTSKYGDANVTATLIATVAGEPVYAHLGWDSLKNFTVKSLDKVDGTREKWKYDVMKYDL